MRLAVLDVGSNAAHLHVVDAYPGGPPLPVFRFKAPTRLAESVRADGALDDAGTERLVGAVAAAVEAARAQRVAELIPLATATIRDATNADRVRARVRAAAGVDLVSLSGEDEARLTFLAVRRWLGWSAGPLLLLDIGGASMEIAQGGGEEPDLAVSLPLGAGLLTRQLLPRHPARRADVRAVRRQVREAVGPLAERLRRHAPDARVVGTSKTFKQLVQLTGAQHRSPDPGSPHLLCPADLHWWTPRLAAMSVRERAQLPGVSPARARQLLAGAITAATVMGVLGVDRLEVCPWALREGLLLRRMAELAQPAARRQAMSVALARPAA